MNQEENINTQAAAEVMTTDEFHRLLVENTEAINKEREEYEYKRSELQLDLDDQKTFCQVSNRKLQKEKLEYKIQVNRQQEFFEQTECNIRETLTKANKEFNEKYAKLKSEHALKNLELQNERHKIFEAYRNSGGQILPKTLSRCTPKDGADQSLKMEEQNSNKQFN